MSVPPTSPSAPTRCRTVNTYKPRSLTHICRLVPVHVLAVQLVVSAHWEEDKPTVMVGEKTELLFDYYGFPADTYRYQYPAPGSPAVAQRVQQLLSSAGLPCGTERKSGILKFSKMKLRLMTPSTSFCFCTLSRSGSPVSPE